MKPFALKLDAERQEAAMIGNCGDGLYWVEPMRFLFPFQAKREANAEFPKMLSHVCHRRRRP